MKKYKVYFADLTHTGQGLNADNIPLGIGLIAAYVKSSYNNISDLKLFKIPNKLNEQLLTNIPQVISFSNYAWNENLSLAYAAYIKKICNPKNNLGLQLSQFHEKFIKKI